MSQGTVRKKIAVICPGCGVARLSSYVWKDRGTGWCRACAKNARSDVQAQCEQCQETFFRKEQWKDSQRFCSHACAHRASKERIRSEMIPISVSCQNCSTVRLLRYLPKKRPWLCRPCSWKKSGCSARQVATKRIVMASKRAVLAARITMNCRSCGSLYPNTSAFFYQNNVNRSLTYRECRKCRRERATAISKTPEARSKHSERGKIALRAMRQKMFDALGHSCSCCGETEERFLTLEHLAGNGRAHRRSNGVLRFYREMENEGWPKDKYTILCMNCNHGKYHNGGICPHQAVRIKYKQPIPFAIDKLDLAAGVVALRRADHPAIGLGQ